MVNPFSNISQQFLGLAVGSEPTLLENILLVGAKDTPMLRELTRVPVGNVKSVWLTDAVRKPREAKESAVAYVQDFKETNTDTTTENENVVQMFRDDIAVAEIFKKIKMMGETEKERQLAKAGIEHAMDIEMSFWGDQEPYLSKANAEKNMVGGVWHFAKNEVDNRNDTGAATKILTFDDLLDLQQQVYNNGGDPRKIFVGAALKRRINDLVDSKKSRFVQVNQDPLKAQLLVNSIESDFGLTDIVLCRYVKEGRILVADPTTMELGVLWDTEVKEQAVANLSDATTIVSAMTFHFRNGYALAAGYGYK